MSRFISILSFFFFSTDNTSAAVLQHLRGKVHLLTETGNKVLARGEVLQRSHQIVMPVDSQLQIAWDTNSFMEVRGPARFRWIDNRLILEFGRYLFFSADSYPMRVQVLEEDFRPSSNAALEIDIPITRSQAQFLLFAGRANIAGLDLETHRLYLLDKQKIQAGNRSPEFSQERRALYTYTQSLLEDLDREKSHKSYRNQFIVSFQAHLLRFSDADKDSSFVQNTSGFGPIVEWNHKRYLNIISYPKRIQYLRAPAFRVGLGANFFTTQIRPTKSVTKNSQFLGAHAASGFSWLGLSIEGVLNYQTGRNDFVNLASPLAHGFRTRYEWDLLEITQSDILISLGYSQLISKLKASEQLSPAPTSISFQAVRHGIELSFHMNF